MTQIRELDGLTHRLLIVVIQDLEHLFRVMVIDLNGAEVNSFRSELFDLMLNQAPLRVTTWVIIATRLMIIISMTWSISYQYCIFSLRSPLLLESFLKASSNILWSITTSKGTKSSNKLLASYNVSAKVKDYREIMMVSISND